MIRTILIIAGCLAAMLVFDQLNVTSSFGGASLQSWAYWSVMSVIAGVGLVIWWRFA